MLRITFLIGSLGNHGGSERSLCLLANAWAHTGRVVTVLTFDDCAVSAYPLHSSITCCNLNLFEQPQRLLDRARRIVWRYISLREAVEKSRPDIVVGFTPAPNVWAILVGRSLRVPVIVSERTDPALFKIGWKWNMLRRVVYPFANKLVCQTGTALARFPWMSKARGTVVPNLICAPPALRPRRTARAGQNHVLIAMGRLAWQKGFDILLIAFSRIAERHPSWSLKILGEGDQRSSLEKLAETLHMHERVQFPGVRVRPYADLCQADLFVLSSRFEGFPNALCEAMACGLPVVSFDCPSGPRDIIRNGVDGILVPAEDTGALAAALDDLMGDGLKREQLASRAPEILERFSANRVLSLWDEVFAELTSATAELRCSPESPGV